MKLDVLVRRVRGAVVFGFGAIVLGIAVGLVVEQIALALETVDYAILVGLLLSGVITATVLVGGWVDSAWDHLAQELGCTCFDANGAVVSCSSDDVVEKDCVGSVLAQANGGLAFGGSDLGLCGSVPAAWEFDANGGFTCDAPNPSGSLVVTLGEKVVAQRRFLVAPTVIGSGLDCDLGLLSDDTFGAWCDLPASSLDLLWYDAPDGADVPILRLDFDPGVLAMVVRFDESSGVPVLSPAVGLTFETSAKATAQPGWATAFEGTIVEATPAEPSDVGTLALAATLGTQGAVIDVKPGGYPNSINLGSKGNVPIGILSSPIFDATLVDPASVVAAGAGVAVRGKGKYKVGTKDLNGDGLYDSVIHVETDALVPDDGVLEVWGTATDGTVFEARDTIWVVPEKDQVQAEAPAPPSSLVAAPDGFDVVLTWDRSPTDGVVGYRIYYGTESGGGAYSVSVDVEDVTTHTIPALQVSTYYFAATAYDGSGVESSYSNEVSVVIDPPVEDCFDGVDNDGDGAIDCKDDDCLAQCLQDGP